MTSLLLPWFGLAACRAAGCGSSFQSRPRARNRGRRGDAGVDLWRRRGWRSIAYFLSRRGVEAVVIERTAIASAASGKSGGFLALDRCDGSPLAALARRSFELHAALAT